MDGRFRASRDAFRTPIADLAAAADLLALAADSLLAGNDVQARVFLRSADMPSLRAYTRSIQSKTTADIHCYRDVPDLPPPVPAAARGPRQPSKTIGSDIFSRDGCRCRYCGCRVVHPEAQSVMSGLLPGAVAWGDRDVELNAAFYTLRGVLDHVVPHAHGGASDADNVVTSCQPCNYGKGSYFLEQFGLNDPRLRPPKVDEWDGLRRVLPLRPARVRVWAKTASAIPVDESADRISRRPGSTRGSTSFDRFTASLDAADHAGLDVLLHVAAASAGIGLTWSLTQVLLLKIETWSGTISPIGLLPNGTVQLPWWIGPHKKAFRFFAETIAAAVPDGKAYETEKMWRVSSSGQVPRIAHLGQCPDAVRDAFEGLHRLVGDGARRNGCPPAQA
ncbi:HNH endonuclease [Lichenicoccus roseus]|uniref:HNH endonuclease 5 domain-containing protein n=1 Tax=Lichenicoccus roseus TaxID=2683649 RepID=A0A5R9J2G2_9PROT|nr:HNH endonuclease signature motif containing protein [Lichenicoccus roseus]TLU71814.1 hypothetical protein FE263_15245 [Lichenicoccus roseus]